MPVSMEILPFSSTLDMFGQPCSSSAYSLSGYVSISLTSIPSYFEPRQTVRLLLQSLEITFEGQSELITTETGYSSVRLCTVTREAAPKDPVEISNEGHEESDKPCTWNVVFNLPIPGWLPASSTFGDNWHGEAGNSYGLYATAKFLTLDDNGGKSWFYSTFCSPFVSRTRTIQAPSCPIMLNRSFIPPSSDSPNPLNSTYAVEPLSEGKSCIPADVLSKVEVLVSVPTHIDMAQSSFPVTMRLSARQLPESERKKLRTSEFTFEVEQSEKYRDSPSSDYKTLYPVPPRPSQPPFVPLRSVHPADALYELGLLTMGTQRSLSRSFSLVPPDEPFRYLVKGDGYIFADDDQETEGDAALRKWYAIGGDVPFGQSGSNDEEDSDVSKAKNAERHLWKKDRRIRETSGGPLLVVRHDLHIWLTCTYDGEEERVSQDLHFCVPLTFVRMKRAEVFDPPSISPPQVSPSAPMPYTSVPALPPYSRLYHSNGEPKIDDSIPLPRYTPLPSSDPDEIELCSGKDALS